MTVLENRIAKKEKDLLTTGATEKELALLTKLKTLRTEEIYGNSALGRMIPLAPDEDLYNQAMFNKSLQGVLDSVIEPFEDFINRPDIPNTSFMIFGFFLVKSCC